jgi:hypothetical protein
VPHQRNRGEAGEQRDEAQDGFAVAEQAGGRLDQEQEADRRGLDVVERPEQAGERARGEVQGQERFVEPE